MMAFRKITFLALALLFLAGLSAAQDSKKETQLRTVHGVVNDKSENPLPGSVVFLKNLRTNTVRSSPTSITRSTRNWKAPSLRYVLSTPWTRARISFST